jgi:hypothetical protein
MNTQDEIANLLNNIKGKLELEKSFYTTKRNFNREMLIALKPHEKDILKESFIHSFAKYIIENQIQEINTKDFDEFTEYSLELLVLPKHKMKTIVETIVKLMPQNVIDELRK